jgi:predicted flap endonuclease-1-like 5' DNA nuclease
MLLQHRQVAAAATASSAPAPTRQQPVQRAPTRLYAAQHKKPKSNSSSGSTRSSAAVPKELVLKAVPGIGKVYMQKLQEKGISSVDVLKESILGKLKQGETNAGFTPAVRYLQVREL